MNTPVSFETSRLLKEKGFDNYCDKKYITQCLWQKPNSRDKYKNSEIHQNSSDVSAPTIAEVVMWLYEKHKLWILPLPTVTGHFAYKVLDVQLDPENTIERPPYTDVSANDYNTPTEAYEAAIEYTLNHLI